MFNSKYTEGKTAIDCVKQAHDGVNCETSQVQGSKKKIHPRNGRSAYLEQTIGQTGTRGTCPVGMYLAVRLKNSSEYHEPATMTGLSRTADRDRQCQDRLFRVQRNAGQSALNQELTAGRPTNYFETFGKDL